MKVLILSFLLLTSLVSYSQAQYYTTDGKNRLTESKVRDMLEEKAEKMGQILGKKLYGSLTVESTETKNDSVISRITFHISDKQQESLIRSGPLDQFKNERFPDFNLKTLSGGNLKSEDLKGKPTMINFWFTRCKPCIDEMPVLNQLAEKYKNEFNFIAITYENNEDVKKFLTKYPFDFKHLVNSQQFIDSLGIEAYPTNIFLDRNGLLKYVKGGIPYVSVEGEDLRMGEGNEIVEILEELK